MEECPWLQLDLYITNPDITNGYSENMFSNSKGQGVVIDVEGE
jgi:hypothetical protein